MSSAESLPEVLLDLRVVRERLTGVGRYLLEVYAELQHLAAADLRVTALVRRGQTLPVAGPARSLAGKAGDTTPLSLGQWWRLPRALRSDPYALFHYTYFDLPPIAGRPLVATCYDLEPLRHPELFSAKLVAYSRLFARSLRRADRVVTISHATARDVEAIAGVPADRIVVTHLGVDAVFRPQPDAACEDVRARYGLPGRYVFYVGNTMPHKNLARVVEAMAHVRRGCGPVPLVIAGAPDKYRPTLEAAAARHGLGDGLRPLGRVPDADLPALMSAAAVFVYPSLYEGFGLPVLEAMACGCPVVTSNRASLPEVVGDAALACDPLDTSAIADAIATLLTDAAAAARLRAAGPLRAAGFTWSRCAALHRDLYLQLLRA
jgi:alpha-1,3-rhamnosyl/mannosyltransferase